MLFHSIMCCLQSIIFQFEEASRDKSCFSKANLQVMLEGAPMLSRLPPWLIDIFNSKFNACIAFAFLLT